MFQQFKAREKILSKSPSFSSNSSTSEKKGDILICDDWLRLLYWKIKSPHSFTSLFSLQLIAKLKNVGKPRKGEESAEKISKNHESSEEKNFTVKLIFLCLIITIPLKMMPILLLLKLKLKMWIVRMVVVIPGLYKN